MMGSLVNKVGRSQTVESMYCVAVPGASFLDAAARLVVTGIRMLILGRIHLKQRPLLKQARFLCIAALLFTGCSTARPYPPLSLSPSARLVEVANSPVSLSSDPIRRVGGVQPEESARRNVLV